MTLKSGRWSALTVSVLTLALLGNGSAQNLGAYRTLAQQLDAAAAGAGRDSLSTLKQLDAAQAALDQLKPTLGNAKTGVALQDTMNAVRAAQARTPTDLQAQVQLARGLMRKTLYDQTMTLLATSPANGAEHLTLLARELGVDPVSVNASMKAGKLNVVSWELQKSAASKLSAALAGVQAQQTGASYLNLARAAGWFTVVQDTGRLVNPPLRTEQFSQALAQLAGGQLPELQSSLQGLRGGVKALNAVLAKPEAVTAGGQTPPQTPPIATPPPAKNDAPQPDVSAPAGVAGVPGAAATYAALGRALNAATQGNLPAARTELTRSLEALAAAPATLRNTAGYDQLVRRTTALSKRQALRPADVQALIGELGALEARQAGVPQSATVALATSGSALGGGLRAILTLLIALAAAAPLYLLNLAFGGKNPFWRAISAALVLLLLPTLFDGLFGFLGWLGDLLNVPFLQSLLFLTPGQSAFGVPLRLLVTALALGLATYGFRGLCIQFGLLSGRKQNQVRPVAAVKPKNPDQTSFDWDEEL